MRCFGDRQNGEEIELFNAAFPNHAPISKSIVSRTVECFQETVSIIDKTRTGRIKNTAFGGTFLDVLQEFIEKKTNNFEFCKAHLVQEQYRG